MINHKIWTYFINDLNTKDKSKCNYFYKVYKLFLKDKLFLNHSNCIAIQLVFLRLSVSWCFLLWNTVIDSYWYWKLCHCYYSPFTGWQMGSYLTCQIIARTDGSAVWGVLKLSLTMYSALDVGQNIIYS